MNPPEEQLGILMNEQNNPRDQGRKFMAVLNGLIKNRAKIDVKNKSETAFRALYALDRSASGLGVVGGVGGSVGVGVVGICGPGTGTICTPTDYVTAGCYPPPGSTLSNNLSVVHPQPSSICNVDQTSMTPTSAPAPAAVAGPNNAVAMSQLGTVYATKRRRRNGKSLKPPQKDGVTKSNPSKRHRERLNAELDTLASLLPFEQNILSKLDRLSILRLSVSYLRTKSYFQVVMHKDKDESGHHDSHYRARELAALAAYDHHHLDGEMFLQALNGFLLILTCDGEVFFATHSIESYLGFHQSDIVHQSVYELVHSEDREELQRQLMWNSFLPTESAGLPLNDALAPQHGNLLERSFTVRFRCLLDNTSGFLRLDIRGRVKVLHGQNRKTEDPPLALFALCTPFGPPSLLEVPQKEVMFKSKHKLDLALVSMDQRGKMLLGYSDAELANLGGYDLVHYDDLAYVASAHQELLKTGASGMIAYRYQTKDGGWQWLQTSSRLVYKNSKPDFVISTHRPLMEEEGRDLLGKRTMDFKVSYLDAGLTNSYFSDSDSLPSSGITPALPAQPTPQRVNRRYKTQLRDFLSTCRGKRTKLSSQSSASPPATPTVASVDYLAADTSAAAAVAAAYSNLNNIYPTPYAPTAVAATTDPSLTTYIGHTGNYHQTLYPAGALDNRYLTATENLFQYRPLGSYYPEYHATTGAYNGFIDVSLPTYDPHQLTSAGKGADDKIYCQQLGDSPKYGYVEARHHPGSAGSPYAASPVASVSVVHGPGSRHSLEGGASSSNSAGSSPVTGGTGVLTPKMEDVKPDVIYGGEAPRQTVLMWGAPPSRSPPRNNGTYSPPSQTHVQSTGGQSAADPLKSLAEMNSVNGDCKWKQTSPSGQPNNSAGSSSPTRNKGQQQSQHSQHQHHQQYAVSAAHYATSGYPPHPPHPGHGHPEGGAEVWQGVQHHHHHYQYYPPYHHHHHQHHQHHQNHPAPPATRHAAQCAPHTSPGGGIAPGVMLGTCNNSLQQMHQETVTGNTNNSSSTTITTSSNTTTTSSSTTSSNNTSSNSITSISITTSSSNNNSNNSSSNTSNNNNHNNNTVSYHPGHHHHHVVGQIMGPQIQSRTPGVLCCPSLR